jgi:CheY-like chemotaxis protein
MIAGKTFIPSLPLRKRAHGAPSPSTRLTVRIAGPRCWNACTLRGTLWGQGVMMTNQTIAKPIRILVVDDHQKVADTMAEMLRQDGYVVDTAYSGQDCLQVVEAQDFDLILLDLRLPGIDGWEVAKTLRANEKTRHIKVIALTANCEDDDLRRSEEAGIDHHIAKPIRIADLEKLFPAAVS